MMIFCNNALTGIQYLYKITTIILYDIFATIFWVINLVWYFSNYLMMMFFVWRCSCSMQCWWLQVREQEMHTTPEGLWPRWRLWGRLRWGRMHPPWVVPSLFIVQVFVLQHHCCEPCQLRYFFWTLGLNFEEIVKGKKGIFVSWKMILNPIL